MSSQRSGQARGFRRWISLAAAVVMAGVGLTVVTPPEEAQAAAPGPRDATAVLFSYTWNQIAQECTNTLGPAGYGYVQTSPPQEHVQGSQWWVYYQPVSYDLESRMGTEAEFINMVETCNAAGVEVIVDAVINHMSGAPAGGTGWAGTPFSYYEYPGLYSSGDFHNCRRDINNYNDRWEVQECNLVGLSDLNTGSDYVQSTLAAYLDRLSDMGVAGFRIDAVKHIAADDMWGMWNKVKDKDDLYVVQEVIRAHGEPIQPEEYLGIGDIHEFAYARSLKEAFGGGSIDWLISGAGIGSTWGGYLDHADAAVFVDNHDTERNGETLSYKDGRTYDLAQIFTLAWDYGSPSIHSGYAFTDYDAGPALDGSGRVIDPQPGQNGWTFKHAQNDIMNMVGFRNTTYGTSVANKWSSSDGRTISFDRGNKGFVAINNGSSPVQREFSTSLPDGDYYNVITATNNFNGTWNGDSVSVRNGKLTVTVPAHDAVALHVDALVEVCTDTSAPSVPTGLTAEATGTSVSLTWDKAEHDCGIAGYEVERQSEDGATTVLETSDTALVDSGLSALTEYTYRVRAVAAASGSESQYSVPVSVTTEDKSAGTSVYYKLPDGWADANIHYSIDSGPWTTPPGTAMSSFEVDGWYVIELDVTEGQQITAAFNNGSSWDNNGGRDYTIVGGGAWSVSGGNITDGAPTPPDNTAGETTVHFELPAGWTQANIHYRIDSGEWTTPPGTAMKTSDVAGWFVFEVDAKAGQTITAAFNNGSGVWDNNGGRDFSIPGGGAWSVSQGAVTSGKPTTPEPLGGELVLFYKPNSSWTSANVHYRLDAGTWTSVPGVPLQRVATCDAGDGWYTTTIATEDASTVTAAFNNGSGQWDNNGGQDYVFSTPIASLENGSISTVSPCGVVEPIELTAPTNVVATATSASALRVSWDDVPGASSYLVTYQTGDEAPISLTVNSVTTSITGLSAETEYSVSVAAIGADGEQGPASEPVSATTKEVNVSDGEGSGSVAGATTGTPLGGDPREDSIYFMMTARWYDGDESNNMGGALHEKSGNADYDDPMFRGDFSGVIEKLDYIKALGFSAIWITPVVTNRSDYDFHGYHGWDFQRIDPRLESEGATYQELIDAAHDRGIKIYQDVVYNHSSRWGEKNVFVPTVYGVQDDEWSWYYDDPIDGKVYDPSSPDPDGSTYNGDLWSETQPADQNCNNWGVQNGWSQEGYKVYNCQWPNATSGMFPSEYYHQCWIGNWEGKDSQDCWIHEDLADFNTESQVVQDYLIETYNKYIDMGVDGFRVDTAVHIPRVIWNRHFLPALHQHAVDVHGEKGEDFYVFGEVAQFVHDKWNRGSVNHSAPFYTWKERREYSLDDVVAAAEQFTYENDMGVHGQPTSVNHLLDGNTYRVPDYSEFSGMNIIDMRMHMNFSDASTAFHSGMDSDDATNDATFNAVYVDSHDYGPGKSSFRYDGGTDAWAENMSLMWTFRGIPVLYYGSEIEFQAGEQIDCGPSCPLATTGRAYFGDHLEGTVVASDFGVVESATGEVANTLNQPLVKHVQTLNQIRRAVPALQKGQYSREGISGNIAYKKRFTDADVDSFVLVAVSESATFSGIPNGRYVDAVTGDVKVVSNGNLTVSLSGKGNMRAYVLDLPGNPAPGKVGNGSDYLK